MPDINMIPFYAETLAEKDFLKEDIEKLYATNKYQFYAFEENNDDSVFFIGRQLPLQKEELFRKLIGMFSYLNYIATLSNSENLDEGSKENYYKETSDLVSAFLNLFKKGYKKAYNTINLYKRTYDTIIVHDVCKILFKDIDNYSAEEINNTYIAILFLCIHTFKDFSIGEDVEETIETVFYPMQNKNIQTLNYQRFKANKENKKQIDEIYKQMPKALIKDMFAYLETNKDVYYRHLYDNEVLSSVTLYQEYPLTEEDIKDIATIYWYTSNHSEFKNMAKKPSLEEYTMIASHMKLLLKAYNKEKEYYFSHNQETMFIEIENREEQLKLLVEEVKTKEAMLQSSKKQLSSILEEYTKKINQLERKVKKLEIELSEAKSNTNELQALRELALSLNQNEENQEDTNKEIDYDYLSSLNILVIGGNLNWQKKLKEKLPNWKYIDASVRTFDKSLFNTDMVVLNTNSMNHSLFYFVMDNVSKNIKIHFVSKTNIEECISDIYCEIKN